MEKSGRRPLLLGGMFCMGIAAAVITVALNLQAQIHWMAYISIICIIVFVIGFAIGLGMYQSLCHIIVFIIIVFTIGLGVYHCLCHLDACHRLCHRSVCVSFSVISFAIGLGVSSALPSVRVIVFAIGLGVWHCLCHQLCRRSMCVSSALSPVWMCVIVFVISFVIGLGVYHCLCHRSGCVSLSLSSVWMRVIVFHPDESKSDNLVISPNDS